MADLEGDGNIRLVLASNEVAVAMDEAVQMVRLQRSIGWNGEEVPTHTLRSFSLGAVTGLVDLGYLLLAKNNRNEVLGFARVANAGPGNQHYLHELAVSKEVQLKGLGKILMNGVEEESQRRGAEKLVFTFNALNPRNAFFYLEKCRGEVLRVLPDFYGKPIDGRAYSLFAQIILKKERPISQNIVFPIPVVSEPAQFARQSIFKIPVPSQGYDYLPFNHPLVDLLDNLLLGLLTKDEYSITGFSRSRTHFWIVSRREH